ncbi:MAG: galactokinase [Herbinix sp.]|jgi:galactokinase|nr:galactokinase [Herbinix sp.]
MKSKLLQKFNEVFGADGEVRLFFAPGRVNLIGEHTDYNGGHVFPSALTIGTYAAVRLNQDKTLRFYSMNFENLGVITSSVEGLVNKTEDDWANYPKGTIWAFKQKGYSIEQGMDVLYYGNIPNQSGLSSSASIEVLTGYILKELFQLDIDLTQIALISQFAENKFIGVSCGIMDQFAIAMGKADHAIFLDTSDLSYEYAPIKLPNAKIVIACSNKKRGLGDSKYNERRKECEDALKDLQSVVKINSLGELTEDEFEANKGAIKNPVQCKRAKHAVYENQRTIKAIQALKENKIKEFGELMNASHVSLRDDYEVTGIELDTLVEASWKQDGVIGSRMTGAGFGGCTVSIVENDKVDRFIEEVGKTYETKIGYKADFYIVDIGNGPFELV